MPYDRNTGGGTTSDGMLDALTDLVGEALDGVESPLMAAARDGRTFLAATGMQDVLNNNALFAVLSNPAGSGRDVWLMERWFDTNRVADTVPLEYTAYPAPVSALANTGFNAQLGKPASATGVAVMTWEAGADLIAGPEASSAALPTGGVRETLALPFCLEPGEAVGFRIDAGDKLPNTDNRMAISFVWFEETI